MRHPCLCQAIWYIQIILFISFLSFRCFLCLCFQMSSGVLCATFFLEVCFLVSLTASCGISCCLMFDWFMLPLVAICFESIISFLLVMNLFFWVSTAILRPFLLHWWYCRWLSSSSLSQCPVLKVLARRGAVNAMQLTGWPTHWCDSEVIHECPNGGLMLEYVILCWNM